MKFSDDKSTIIGDPGETIHFEVNSLGTLHLVSYELEGNVRELQDGESVRLRFGEKQNRLRSLMMNFSFSEPIGGSYEIKFVGERGETVIHHITQDVSIPNLRKQFTFFGLEGDPDTDAD